MQLPTLNKLPQTIQQQILQQTLAEMPKEEKALLSKLYSRKHRGAVYSLVGCPHCGDANEISDLRDAIMIQQSRNPIHGKF